MRVKSKILFTSTDINAQVTCEDDTVTVELPIVLEVRVETHPCFPAFACAQTCALQRSAAARSSCSTLKCHIVRWRAVCAVVCAPRLAVLKWRPSVQGAANRGIRLQTATLQGCHGRGYLTYTAGLRWAVVFFGALPHCKGGSAACGGVCGGVCGVCGACGARSCCRSQNAPWNPASLRFCAMAVDRTSSHPICCDCSIVPQVFLLRNARAAWCPYCPLCTRCFRGIS